MSLRVLVTGFEPFGGAPHNPSGDAARALDSARFTIHAGAERRPVEIRGRVLPVVWDVAADELVTQVEVQKPHVVISLGMADRRFRVEQIAGNARRPRPDNRDQYPRHERARPTTTFPTRLPLDSVERALRDAGCEVEPSTDAGGYICDSVFFALMQTHHERGADLGLLRAGFIHVPNHFVVPTELPQDTLNRAILAAIEVTVSDVTAEELRPLF